VTAKLVVRPGRSSPGNGIGLKGIPSKHFRMSIRDVLVSDVIEEKKGKSVATTLEAYHQNKMKEFVAAKHSVKDLQRELDEIEAKIDGLPESAAFGDEMRQLSEMAEEKRRQIQTIQADDKRLDYFLDVGDMLFQYFDAQESLAKGTDIAVKPVRTPTNSVLSYFTESASPKSEAMASPRSPPSATRKKASEIDSKDGLNRDKMLEKYLAIVDPSAIKSGIMPGSGIEPGWGCCPTCDVEMTFHQNEALLGCPRCGHEEFILIDSEKPSYKDPPREITYFAYKKINHFNEWLAQFQAKENTDIPQDIIEAVMKELKKERISDPKKVKKEKIREVLQKLKFSKMYDHVQQIKNRIQQQMTMLTLSKEMEEKLQHMFKEIQPAFIKYCPANRSNFLSYPYVLYKLCQLLEMDEFLPCFQLLKSREKLYQQDQVWEKICKEMRWQFIRSI
jgi:predicted  nucleic acid-binding Zn-ribbon protein